MMRVENIEVELIERDRRDAKNSLRAFVRLDLADDNFRFVMRDLRIIDAKNGLMVAMPSRIVDFHCEFCGGNNVWNASYCNRCGGALPPRVLSTNERGTPKKSYDVIFPSGPNTRKMINDAVLSAYDAAVFRAVQN